MCKFCENLEIASTEFPDDNPYGKLDSSEMRMLPGGVLRIINPEGRGWNNNLPIFQVQVFYCPYCGRKVNDELTMTELIKA